MKMQQDYVVEAQELGCDYGNGRGLFEVNFRLGQPGGAGMVVGVLGPNGAGKTTLLNLILDRQVRTGGKIRVAVGPKDRGYLPNSDYFFDFLSARENLDYLSHLKTGEARGWDFLVQEDWDMANRLQVASLLDRPVNRLSSGELRKVQLMASLIGPAPGILPRLVVWDEPHNNLDIVSNLELGQVLAGLRAKGCLVIITSHVVQSLQDLLDQVIFLRDGRLSAHLEGPFKQDLTSLFMQHCLGEGSKG